MGGRRRVGLVEPGGARRTRRDVAVARPPVVADAFEVVRRSAARPVAVALVDHAPLRGSQPRVERDAVGPALRGVDDGLQGTVGAVRVGFNDVARAAVRPVQQVVDEVQRDAVGLVELFVFGASGRRRVVPARPLVWSLLGTRATPAVRRRENRTSPNAGEISDAAVGTPPR